MSSRPIECGEAGAISQAGRDSGEWTVQAAAPMFG